MIFHLKSRYSNLSNKRHMSVIIYFGICHACRSNWLGVVYYLFWILPWVSLITKVSFYLIHPVLGVFNYKGVFFASFPYVMKAGLRNGSNGCYSYFPYSDYILLLHSWNAHYDFASYLHYLGLLGWVNLINTVKYLLPKGWAK